MPVEVTQDDRGAIETGDIFDGCGKAYRSVYAVPNDVWAKIAPKPETLGDYIEHQGGGLLCLNCADEAARRVGLNLFFTALCEPSCMAGKVGLEPTTVRLTAGCSTTELQPIEP